ncbi:hypothetical protein JW930_01485 [Candidatus Woesearchaeota archaeon]|nr:hypothetical protein [Candidatus Woesearchaeota archaeon]
MELEEIAEPGERGVLPQLEEEITGILGSKNIKITYIKPQEPGDQYTRPEPYSPDSSHSKNQPISLSDKVNKVWDVAGKAIIGIYLASPVAGIILKIAAGPGSTVYNLLGPAIDYGWKGTVLGLPAFIAGYIGSKMLQNARRWYEKACAYGTYVIGVGISMLTLWAMAPHFKSVGESLVAYGLCFAGAVGGTYFLDKVEQRKHRGKNGS